MTASYLVVATQTDRPTLYIVPKAELDPLVRAVRHPHFKMTVFALKPKVTQTPNPFNGLICMEEAHVLPSEGLKDILNDFVYNLDGMSQNQIEAEVSDAIRFLKEKRDMLLHQLKQVEFIDLKPGGLTSEIGDQTHDGGGTEGGLHESSGASNNRPSHDTVPNQQPDSGMPDEPTPHLGGDSV